MTDAGEMARSDARGTPAAAEIGSLVDSLIGMMRGGNIAELDVAFGSVSIRLRGHAGSAPPVDIAPAVRSDGAADSDGDGASEHVVTAPMIGTFYAAPSPGAAPFIEAGDAVAVGQTIGIIEAMKIMNEITADRTGRVREILVGDAQPVEYGSPLVRLALDGDRSS